MPAKPVTRGAVALRWAANPLVQWGLGLLLVGGAVWFVFALVPGLYTGLKDGGKRIWSDVSAGSRGLIDNTLSLGADILGRPQSQNLDERTRADQVKGLIVEGDRALSDAVDSPWLYLKDLVRGPKN